MINHLQTLLVNESASALSALDTVEYGYVDPAFRSVPLDRHVSAIYGELFPSTLSVLEKVRLVRRMLPFMEDPEFAAARSLFDPRVVGVAGPVTSVFRFHQTLSPDTIPLSSVSSHNAPSAFLLIGDGVSGDMADMLEQVRATYQNSKETTRRFSALLYAISAHLEAARLKSLSAGGNG